MDYLFLIDRFGSVMTRNVVFQENLMNLWIGFHFPFLQKESEKAITRHLTN